MGELNGNFIKIFKAHGKFTWHQHDKEDEFFLVVKGQLKIKLRDNEITLNEGEFFIIPRKTAHLPYTEKEAHVLLFEPKEVINTGNVKSEKTVENLEWI